ncbi:MAG: hypothetical protein HC772_11760 [Leptolyngbyaceae cyanobacterium CRU_2_3]|nr:hypothetical protein [Leptolyngbyaceae cyanobacterium CRU_2_3]
MLKFKFPTQILLSMSTAPVLMFLIGSKALATAIIELGQASEEIFRGDRLPILNIPKHIDGDPE